jgi:ABC-2 type transport system ATP-binding protein
MTSAIVCRGLSKDYGSGHGLFDLDLDVAEGEVFGFLGPNGAGKTTTIRLLMGVIHATAGTARIFGLDCDTDSVAVKREVGYLPGDLPQFGGMRGSEVVAYLGGMRGGIDQSRVKDLAERFQLDLGRRFREYSRGNKQKLGLVLAFMHSPRLLILDEPTGGLDPLNQQTFHQLVGEVKAAGATVFLSSHVLSEVEETCSRVGIIRDGKLVSDMSMDRVHEMRFHEVVVEFGGEVPEEAVRAAAGVEDVVVDGQRLTCTVHGGFDPLLAALRESSVLDLVSREPSLESIFLTYYRS